MIRQPHHKSLPASGPRSESFCSNVCKIRA